MKSVAIIGGGAAALAVASFLDEKKFDNTIYEKNKALGRKFLVAGKGGFNLTHSEAVENLIQRYTPTSFLDQCLNDFSNTDFRDWLASIGIPTYVGSSKRVYPERGIKPIEVLQAIHNHLAQKGVKIRFNMEWTGWNDEKQLIFNSEQIVKADFVIFALGGGSWKVTGSDGSWLSFFEEKGIKVVPFQASNCGFEVNWTPDFISKHAGAPLKNIAITCQGRQQKGEAIISEFGLEGNAIYALSPEIRNQLIEKSSSTIFIDLKPTFSSEIVLDKLMKSTVKKISERLKKELKLSAAQIALLKSNLSKHEFLAMEVLAERIKKLPIVISKMADLDEAISTVGGISLSEMEESFQLNSFPSNYCIGEMIDWDAPTGGYLLQACFSMGVALAKQLNE